MTNQFMHTRVQGHSRSEDRFHLDFNQHSFADLSNPGRNLDRGPKLDGSFTNVPGLSNGSSFLENLPTCEVENEVEGDYFDGVFKYIHQMLMEEDLEEKSWMYHDCLALQAAEKAFYQALNDGDPPFPYASPSSPSIGIRNFDDPMDDFNTIWKNDDDNMVFPDNGISFCSAIDEVQSRDRTLFPMSNNDKTVAGKDCNPGEEKSNESGRKISRFREDDNQDTDGRDKKLFARFEDNEIEKTEDCDEALLCSDRNPNFYGESSSRDCNELSSAIQGGTARVPWLTEQPSTSKRGRPRASEKRYSIREVADLRDLLPRYAHAVAIFDVVTAHELLKKIRKHSSPYGDATERLAHCFANALEARVAGMGSDPDVALIAKRASAAEVLKSYLTYVTVCPFQRMSNIFANKSIARLAGSAARIHIIDFGILYGFQWPCIIHGFSLRPGGPPRVRITGIDLPQPGFCPAERVEETGRRLANYAKRFDLPLKYNAIAQKWDTISVEDLKIDGDEMLVVNCMYRLENINDETVGDSSPRNAVMNLIKKINPDVFVHGIVNAGYNAPFFETRFREAMYHFSAMFDMFDATLPREDQERLMFEKEILGRGAMNVIACEGAERIDRPDTYKQWQVKNQRAGFRQLSLDKELLREVRVKVKSSYHKDFLVDEDSNWMLQGWKGRVMYALSCWAPNIKRQKNHEQA